MSAIAVMPSDRARVVDATVPPPATPAPEEKKDAPKAEAKPAVVDNLGDDSSSYECNICLDEAHLPVVSGFEIGNPVFFALRAPHEGLQNSNRVET